MPAPTHSTAIILASGDELLTGQLLDTNSRWIAEQLVSLGIMPIELAAAPDDLPRLVAMIRRAAGAAPLVILTGGLGPTDGDLTRHALAEVLAEPLILDETAEQAIRDMFEKRGRPFSDRQRRQAQRPQSATCIPNTNGTAPGLHALISPAHLLTSSPAHPTDIFCLPGPPGELRPMFAQQVLPRLRPDPSRTIATRLLYVVGLAEADCVDRLGPLTKRDHTDGHPLIGITASGGILTIRIRYQGPGPRDAALEAVDHAEGAVRDALGVHVLAVRDADAGIAALAQSIIFKLRAGKLPRTLAVIESCTGGMLGEMLTAIPGSSAAFLGGHITYSNDLKVRLGVNPNTLKAHGAVSAETAREMARAGLAATGATFTLAITGIAGPEGGTPDKPVGTVHIALGGPVPGGPALRAGPAPGTPTLRGGPLPGTPTLRGGSLSGTPALRGGSLSGTPALRPEREHSESQFHTRRFLFTGDREDIRQRAAAAALTMLHFHLAGHAPLTPRLLWETT
ncbi:MAG TPA: nicotinamide-nucleotide amidohydrolase family protein [Phycisphaerales bacterium]|nr:nicotinamide-nucleotide amidohydrolase family protein [Phycisphaerales bacterium]